MKKATKRALSSTNVTMREFRAAPAKILRRAARTGTNVRVGDFFLAVTEGGKDASAPRLYGCMAATGRVLGDPGELLSAGDAWSTDA